jgi:hypothetical protein
LLGGVVDWGLSEHVYIYVEKAHGVGGILL